MLSTSLATLETTQSASLWSAWRCATARWRRSFKGATIGVFGLWVLGVTAWHLSRGTLPHAFSMGAVGVAALLANAASFGLLWAYRSGDANMRSAWICT